MLLDYYALERLIIRNMLKLLDGIIRLRNFHDLRTHEAVNAPSSTSLRLLSARCRSRWLSLGRTLLLPLGVHHNTVSSGQASNMSQPVQAPPAALLITRGYI